MFLAFFGWYPAVRPSLEKQPAVPRWVVKELVFNAAMIAVEALMIFILAPEAVSWGMVLVLLALFNLIFLVYDRALPQVEQLLARRLKRFWN